eukprot:gene17797-24838_t
MILMGRAQSVITRGVGLGRLGELQGRLRLRRRGRVVQAGQHVAHVLNANAATGGPAFEYQLDGHQHRFQPGLRHHGQHLCHDPVSSRVPEQRLAQTQQRRRKVQERRAIAQCARLALHQVDVVLPVVAGLATARQPGMAGYDGVRGRHIDSLGIDAGADDVAGPLAWHRITVARGSHQAGAADPGQPFDVAVEGGRHGHEVRLLQLPHLGHGELPMDRVRGVAPHRTTSLAQPGIEFDERAEATGRGFDPDAPAAVLHVLLDYTLLPAGGDVAEVGVEQVVTAHGCEARVDRALLAALHLVHGGAHVVVDATAGHATQDFEGMVVGIEQHLVRLQGVGAQVERSAVAELEVGYLQLGAHA